MRAEIQLSQRNYGKYDRTPLMVAVAKGNNKFVEFFLKHPDIDMDINVQDGDGNAAIHIAAMTCNNVALAAIVKTQGVDLNLENDEEYTALDILTALENEYGVEIMIDLPGLDVNDCPEQNPEPVVANPSVGSSTECKR